ncbi:zinc finger protein 239-like [Dermacentor silvarum]|uniref:zinc finger protein 239-like n=1 Tax=Dermacentor silvarum TaxID=543639 RepID=UPI002100E23E|nr:zinc finger protein 239-like [Dermacentor silvarum]
MACHTRSKVVGQVEVGAQCSLPLAHKSVGCSFKAESESRSVQTTETVEQLSTSSVSRPSISRSSATCDNSKQECLHRCHLCEYETDKLFLLEAHASVHTGEKPFQCPSCLRSFSRKTNLKEHLRTHTGEKPFECPSCSMSFSKRDTLNVHLRTHTGEKPFQCPSCPQSFSQKANLMKHLCTHTGKKQYECPSCSQSFSKRDTLNVHLRTHAEGQLYETPVHPHRREAISVFFMLSELLPEIHS